MHIHPDLVARLLCKSSDSLECAEQLGLSNEDPLYAGYGVSMQALLAAVLNDEGAAAASTTALTEAFESAGIGMLGCQPDSALCKKLEEKIRDKQATVTSGLFSLLRLLHRNSSLNADDTLSLWLAEHQSEYDLPQTIVFWPATSLVTIKVGAPVTK